MTAHTNAELTRRGYAAFATGDLNTLRDLMSEDAVWHQPGHTALAGDYVGHDGIFGYFGKLIEMSGGTFTADPIDILADDERAVVLQHSTARRDGKVLDTRHVLVFELRDGKFTDTQVYEADPDQDDTFWS